MIILGQTLISESLFQKRFVCNTAVCKGACCVQGDAGAPVTAEEIQWLNDNLDTLAPYLNEESLHIGNEQGFFVKDFEDNSVTNCRSEGECIFLIYEQGVAKCGIEKAYHAVGTDFKKPISCHLYPIRITNVGDYEALNYHDWEICSPALKFGSELGVPMFRFLKEPLTRKYGEAWYEELEEIYTAWEAERK